MTEDFNKDPRSYAIELLEEGLVDAETLVTALVKYMSMDDVKACLDANELSPRFTDLQRFEEAQEEYHTIFAQ